MTLRPPLAAALLALSASGACSKTPPPPPPPPAPAVSQAPPPTPAPAVEAERAFAADALAMGIKGSFLKHSADDAIVLEGTPVNAHEKLSKAPDPKPGQKGPKLVWWPLWAGMSKSGDLGFTTGPFAVNDRRAGYYFTVWKKQADGTWKWVFDAGLDADPNGAPGEGTPAEYLPLAAAGSSSPEAASSEVKAAEAELAKRAANDLPGAYLAHLADDARVHSDGVAPGKGRASFAAALAPRGNAAEFSYAGGGASQAGDLVWTYGSAHWGAGAEAKRGHYARIWQKRAEGWRLVFDEILPPREPPKPKPAAGQN
jgi:ketosteroid isomerase-like protein